MSNYQLSVLDIVKISCQTHTTKDSFKITIRNRHVYIDIGWLEYETIVPFWGIWNDDRNKMIVLPSFKLAKRLNSQNTNETEFINELWHILFINIGMSNWHNWSFDLT
jgi:hypothetical protein